VAMLMLNAGFFAVITSIIWLFASGHYRIATTLFALFLAIAPLCFSEPWIKRISFSLSAQFAIFGGCVGFFLYPQMFSFYWFKATFNEKGAGPVGLMLFVVLFATISGAVAYWLIRRMLGHFFSRNP